ncbi:MAG TPA: DUF4118 domain-containing protein, partial [Blastocatellia bacterium]|nr:DUF4118 domain-containing protein [Blastocatellia bacterium]
MIIHHGATDTHWNMSIRARLKLPPEIVRYGVAIIGVALATAIRLLLNPYLGEHLSFITYFITTIVIAIYFGLGPALLTVFLGAALGTYLFIRPVNRLAIAESSGLILLIPYLVLSIGLSVLIKVIQDARRRAEQTAVALAESRERLATILASIGDAVIATDLEGRV